MKHLLILSLLTFGIDIVFLIFCVISNSSRYNREQEYEQLKKDMRDKEDERIGQEKNR